jgi:AraC-like DNA-binding protein
MKNPKLMTESTEIPKVDRLAAFLDAFKLSVSVVAPSVVVNGPCLLLKGAANGDEGRIVLRLQGGGALQPDLRVAVLIEFDNAINPLMTAVPDEVSVLLRDCPSLRLTAEAFLSEVEGRRCGRVAALNRLAEVMVLMMLRQVIEAGASQAGLLAALSHPSLHRALVSMHDQPSKPWTVEELADRAAMSRTQFMSTFRRVVGTTPIAYLSAWRLTLASRHLKAGHPVNAVARRVGFSSAAAFSRAFSRAYGHPPAGLKAAN